MVYCSILKYLKLFYISVASFHASSTMVKDNNGKLVAFKNLLRSSDGAINHKYTFIANSSYAHCFRDPREFTWLYKDAKSNYKLVSFSSSINAQKPRPTSSKPVYLSTPLSVNPTPIKLKPITRSSIRPIIRPRHHDHNDSSSSDDE